MAEDDVRDELMRQLFDRFGKRDTWVGAGNTAEFKLDRPGLVGRVSAERDIKYTLPQGKVLAHCVDVLVEYRYVNEPEITQRRITIKIKHTSAVTDQFKCRAFDMLHLKREHGDRLHGILFFARASSGIRLAHAKAISYPFDEFIGVELPKSEPTSWFTDVLGAVDARLAMGIG